VIRKERKEYVWKIPKRVSTLQKGYIFKYQLSIGRQKRRTRRLF
jgi:hypothetical protein